MKKELNKIYNKHYEEIIKSKSKKTLFWKLKMMGLEMLKVKPKNKKDNNQGTLF